MSGPRSAPAPEVPGNLAHALGFVVAEAGQDGVFSTAQARRHGLNGQALRLLVGRGVLWRVHRGWFARADPRLDATARHLLRARAAVRTLDGRAVASHHSALVMHGIAVFGTDLRIVHLTHRTNPSYRRAHRSVRHGADTSTRPGHCGAAQDAVAPAFAVIQAGLVHGPLAALVAADSAVGKALTTPEELALAADRYRLAAGIPAVRAVLSRLDARAESPAESLARFALGLLGHRPVPQYRITSGGRTYRADLALEEHRTLIEIDGAVKYAGPDAAAVVMREKQRQAALQRAGWQVLRLTWKELVTPEGALRLDNLAAILTPTLARAVPGPGPAAT